MEKVRFSCPRCSTVMQTSSDKINNEVACPQCHHHFRLVDNQSSGAALGKRVDVDAPTIAPGQRGPGVGSDPYLTGSSSVAGERGAGQSGSGNPPSSGSHGSVSGQETYQHPPYPAGTSGISGNVGGPVPSYPPAGQSVPSQPAYANQASYPGAGGQLPVFSCPYCQTTKPPIWKSEVSPTGWIVFAVLLVSTCFLCFIGFFIRQPYRVCSQCRVRLE